MAKIINFFNHKGGVGKTTLVHNLAFLMADRGKKILVIDADPQMNLTSAFYGLSTSVEYSPNVDEYNAKSSKWMEHTEKYVSFVEHLNQYLKNQNHSKTIFIPEISQQSGTGQINLISGSIKLPNVESDLYSIIKNKNDFTASIPYKFEQAIRQYSNDNQYDFVLIDTSPSASSIINGLIMMSSDYFIAPVFPSFFSLQAVDNLSDIFRNWVSLLSDYQNTQGFQGLSFKVKFLGLVIQMAKRYRGRIQEWTKATEVWVHNVNESVARVRKSLSTRGGFAISEADFKKIFEGSTPWIIDKCCDFTAQLRNIAEHVGKPIVYLTDDICRSYKNENPRSARVSLKKIEGKKEGQYALAFKDIKRSYQKIADDLIKLSDFKPEID